MIHFSLERMAEVRSSHDAWWNGTLNRPLVTVQLLEAYPPNRDPPPAPVLEQDNCADFRWTPDEVIDSLDFALSRIEFMGDAFPYVNLDGFGPGVLAAFCGTRVETNRDLIWFHPSEENKPISEIHAKYDPENIWAKRIKDICRTGVNRWEGKVIIGLPDLGGVMDVAASLVGTENLLYAVTDEPEEVRRLIDEVQTAWYEAYHDIAAVLAPQGGFSHWSGLLSSAPSYIIQCDFAYMLGPAMFKKFVLGTLRKDTERLAHTVYHLDGVGQLPHLDAILSLPQLDAVQWVYGSGKPKAKYWLDVYRKIADAGKRIYVVDGENELLDVLHGVGGSPYSKLRYPAEMRSHVKDLLKEIAVTGS